MKFLHKTLLTGLFVSLTLMSAASAQQLKGIVGCFSVTSNCTGPDGMKTCTLQRNVGTAATTIPSCVTTVQVHANCSIMVSGYVQTFSAVQTGPSPSCQWNCSDCSNVTMNTSTGLPVELLGFEVEGGDTTGEPESEDVKDVKDDG